MLIKVILIKFIKSIHEYSLKIQILIKKMYTLL